VTNCPVYAFSDLQSFSRERQAPEGDLLVVDLCGISISEADAASLNAWFSRLPMPVVGRVSTDTPLADGLDVLVASD